MTLASPIDVVIESRSDDRGDILRLDLVAADGGDLPAFTAGAHVEIAVPLADGTVLERQYSLWGDPADRRRWRLGILLEPASRGGSRTLHAIAKPGTRLRIQALRNHFPLDATAKRSILIGGGIGITPMLAMAAEIAAAGGDFALHVATRSQARTAFLDVLPGFGDRVVLHHDDGIGGAPLVPERDLPAPDEGTHLYVCGPAGFMDWIITSARALGWAEERIHREYFHAEVDASGGAFEVEAKRSGITVTVDEGESIASALEKAGVRISVSCEEGVCGTCLCDVLEGTPDHRDHFLTDEEKAAGDQILICCSRAKTPRLVLDL
ncbi:PDR/VanB family oxidoreductase [Pinisolibacter aquiterrae]|uniref:PDR/VanB family oxidoreductase n=1 Tax=Pinisolibacter aquiterrae TaxID=2815579 RepID=UPI001C3CD1D6|nr:PDR/VanB family oxidoreductase [Pinisolibacter aquiterrae]MBV5265773.1 oxidoreductase [Pinisolibacter aquiterrae]MCC8236662.1 PDR/VanB family oxidoreductase [Pinisolibacter aquiterrae]